MKRTVCFKILLVGWILVYPAYGQQLDSYLELAVEQNLRLKSAFLTYQSALQKVPQVGALPDPQLSLGYFLRPMEQMMGNQVAQISLMQMFPWFGTRAAAKDEASLMAKAKFNTFLDVKSAIRYETKTTWYALYLLEEERRITDENLKILKTLEAIALSRFKSGATEGSATKRVIERGDQTPMNVSGGMEQMPTPPQDPKMNPDNAMRGNMDGGQGNSGLVDVLRIQMEILELENKRYLLTDARQVLQVQFNKLLNRPSETEVVLDDSLHATPMPVPLAQMPDSIFQNNPMLGMLQAEEEAFLAQAKMNQKMGLPMIGVGAQYGILKPRAGNLNPMNGKDMWMPMVSMNIPIWRKKYRAAVNEVQLKRDAVMEDHRETQNKLMIIQEEALKDFRDAERRRELYERQTQLAHQALNILTASYGAGGNDFESVLQMQSKLLAYRLAHMTAVVDQNVSVAQLERLMGR